jgi:hypothetical protein
LLNDSDRFLLDKLLGVPASVSAQAKKARQAQQQEPHQDNSKNPPEPQEPRFPRTIDSKIFTARQSDNVNRTTGTKVHKILNGFTFVAATFEGALDSILGLCHAARLSLRMER